MSLIERLRAVGTRIGLLHRASPVAGEPVAGKPASAPRIETKVVSLAELLRELRPPGDDEQAAALDPDLAALCARAGIQPPASGWTIERLDQALREPTLAKLPPADAQARVLAWLHEDGATPDQVVADACARDAAIDAYAAAASRALARRADGRRERRAQLAAELQRLDAEERDERARWDAWWARKLAAEESMAWAVSHLLEHPVISIDREPPRR